VLDLIITNMELESARQRKMVVMRILINTLLILVLVPTPFVAPMADHSSLAEDQQFRRQAKRIHDRLTGIPASNATIDAMATALHTPVTGAKAAAEIAIQNPAFYNITLKNFAAPWTNEEQTVFTPLNDYSATVIGAIRDGLDFRRILYDDILYIGSPAGIASYSNSSNAHYQDLEGLGPVNGNLASTAILLGPNQGVSQSATTGLDSSATAGVMTSRAAAKAFFSGGTNRAMFRFTLINQLCTDLEPLKDVSRVPDKVRQDISRSPGGDSRIFLNSCVGCHAGMDGMSGAFAYYEWNDTTNRLDYTAGVVQGKYLINSTNFEHGYITDDDGWVNYWRNGPNSLLGNRPGDVTPGWGHPGEILDSKGNAIGNGARELGMELANSKAFAQCQVDKAFKAICLRDPNVFGVDRIARDGMVSNFTGSGYDMREVFTDVAAYCKGS